MRYATIILVLLFTACASGSAPKSSPAETTTKARKPRRPSIAPGRAPGQAELEAAVAAAKAGQLDQGYERCLAALKKNPNLEHAYLLAGSICAMKGDVVCERQQYEDGLNALPRSSALLRERGLLHLQEGQYAEAVAKYELATEITGGRSPEALADLAYAYVYVDRLKEADVLAKTATSLDPKCFTCQMALGQVKLSNKDFPAAVAAFAAARDLRPKDPDARRSEAKAHFLAGQVEQAGTLYEALVAEYPDDGRLLVQAAQVAMAAGRHSDAVTHLTKVAGREPQPEEAPRSPR